MIYDTLENASLYEKINPGFAPAFAFLRKAVLELPTAGRHEILGTDVYANVMFCETESCEKRPWEAHRKYIDIQFLLRGEETIGYSCLSDLRLATDYDEDRDIIRASSSCHRSSCLLTENSFGIFFPQDAHQPNCSTDKPSHNIKIVVKVHV